MATNAPIKAALDLTTWRPSPEKPDYTATSAPTTDTAQTFVKVESFKAIYAVDCTKESESNPVQSIANSECAYEGCLRHKVTKGGASNVIELKHKITTSIMTEAALSAELTTWRPSPEKPDYATTGVTTETTSAHFVFGPVAETPNIWLQRPDSNVTFHLVQIGYSAIARIFELTISIPVEK